VLIPWSTLWRWGLPAALIIAAWMCGYWMGRTAGTEARQAETITQMAKAHEREVALSKETFRLRETRDAEVDRIHARLADALERLRQRPERMPDPARSACEGATGAQLAAGDAGFLERYAADAAEQQSRLDECYGRLEQVSSR
jgi:hypothetical protein